MTAEYVKISQNNEEAQEFIIENIKKRENNLKEANNDFKLVIKNVILE